eukprot:364758-Chlamydomonas_euryale.AAC.4
MIQRLTSNPLTTQHPLNTNPLNTYNWLNTQSPIKTQHVQSSQPGLPDGRRQDLPFCLPARISQPPALLAIPCYQPPKSTHPHYTTPNQSAAPSTSHPSPPPAQIRTCSHHPLPHPVTPTSRRPHNRGRHPHQLPTLPAGPSDAPGCLGPAAGFPSDSVR